MRKILLVFLLIIASVSVMAQSSEIQDSVKDISSELASINQAIINAYQAEQNEVQSMSNIQVQDTDKKFIQINIPMSTLRAASATLKNQPQVATKAQAYKNSSKKQTEDVYEIIINKMWALKRRYEKNRYVRIAGFDINIGVPPSITVSIEFKK